MKNLVYLVIALAVGILLGFVIKCLTWQNKGYSDTVYVGGGVYHKSDTVWNVDTNKVRVPQLVFMTADRSRRAIVIDTIEEENDTVSYNQKVYEDSSYKAWVSGFCVSLDSIDVYPRDVYVYDTTVVRSVIKIKEKRKRWSFGPSLGIGYNGGIKPFFGITINYSLISF